MPTSPSPRSAMMPPQQSRDKVKGSSPPSRAAPRNLFGRSGENKEDKKIAAYVVKLKDELKRLQVNGKTPTKNDNVDTTRLTEILTKIRMLLDVRVEKGDKSALSNDIALGAQLQVGAGQDSLYEVQPVFIIRNNQQFSIKEYLPQLGLHVRFTKIDPQTEKMTFALALDERHNQDYEMFIASDVPRSDILVLQANIFPGINLVWLGCLMMLGGLLMSLIAKRQATS